MDDNELIETMKHLIMELDEVNALLNVLKSANSDSIITINGIILNLHCENDWIKGLEARQRIFKSTIMDRMT